MRPLDPQLTRLTIVVICFSLSRALWKTVRINAILVGFGGVLFAVSFIANELAWL